MIDLTPSERFWPKVQKGDGCWLWTHATDYFGYGRFRMDGKNKHAHRAAWVLTNGAIPSGLFVCHHCDNPPCVRPEHLYLGTAAQNMRDASRRGRLTTKGERQGKAKLTWASVARIRELRELGLMHHELARVFGVSRATIGRVCRHQLWRAP